MAIAADVFAAIAQGHLHMSWQPVRSAGAPDHILYHEGLARIIGSDGQFLSPAQFITALETLGLSRTFDRQIVKWALDELEGFSSATLGVNISGQSAQIDAWWGSLFERLEKAPDVAKRLIIEITETTALAPGAHAFAEKLRRLGCRVALDDFGVGHASVGNALTLTPEIIKIDAFFLHHAGRSEQGMAMLEHLIGIASAIAPIVIVEGVETEEQSRMAALLQSRLVLRDRGCWQQGYHLGRGSNWRGWRYEPQVVPLRDLAKVPGSFRARESYVGLGRTR
jgi:EAL domain-containing protein (putative c-di-GMP-specific phosphodiesterase class I)